MVASDTLVGIVGAVILTIALIGVFIFEASTGAGEADASRADYAVSASGSQSWTPPNDGGTPAPITQDDEPGQYTIQMTVENLPELRGGELFYGAFLRSSSGTNFADTLSKSGANYQLNYETEEDGSDTNMVIVTLERTSSPSTLGVVLFNASLSGNSVSFSGNVSVDLPDRQSVTVDRSGDTASASGTLTGLRVLDGFMYRVWLHDDASSGAAFRLVANITMADNGSTFDAPFSGTVGGATEDGYDTLYVSLEKADSTQTSMSGFPVYRLDL